MIKIQNKNKKIFILASLVILFTLTPILLSSLNQNTRPEGPYKKESLATSGFWNLPFIHVDNNWSSTASAYAWCSGDGSWDNPYLIENITIDASSSPIVSGIWIENSNDYFIIRNSTIFNAGSGNSGAGIRLSFIENGQFTNNTILDNYRGITLWFTDNCSFFDNSLIDNGGQGITLEQSKENKIIENTANGSQYYALFIASLSHNNTVLRNDFNSNTGSANDGTGIHIQYSLDCEIYENKLDYNEYGIRLVDGAENTTIYNNIIENNNIYGVYVDNSSSRECVNNLFYNNTFNNPAGINGYDNGTNTQWSLGILGNYWHDYPFDDLDDDGIGDSPYSLPGTAETHDNFPIWDDGPEPIYINGAATGVGAKNWSWAVNQPWCSGLGTLIDPYIIENLSRDGRGNGFCVSIENSDVYFEVRNCNFSNAGFTFPDAAVLLNNVGNATIIGNDLTDTNFIGVLMDNCNFNFITDNNASLVDLGILMTNSDFNYVIGNTINDNIENAINIDDFSNNNTISGNTVINANSYGISIFSDSNSNIVSGNYLESNNVGISMLDHCDFNKIYDNELIDNNIGVSIHNFNSTNNVVYNNTFLLNNVNGEDDSFNVNYWSYGMLGNYWDDYGGVDANDNGIGDTPYVVSGIRGRLDNYPIWDDGDDINPTISINTPSGGTLFGTDAPTYNLNIFDLNLNTTWYTLNGTATRYLFASTNGVNVVAIDEIGWDALSSGAIIMTFYVNDSSGNPSSSGHVIFKDAILPAVTINSPLGGATFGLDAPVFNLTIFDLNLFEADYVITPSLMGDSFSPVNGINIVTIAESSWDVLAEGSYTFTFSVTDTAGNVRVIPVIINKDLPSSGPEAGIPFGNYYIIFIGIGIASVLLMESKKRKK